MHIIHYAHNAPAILSTSMHKETKVCITEQATKLYART